MIPINQFLLLEQEQHKAMTYHHSLDQSITKLQTINHLAIIDETEYSSLAPSSTFIEMRTSYSNVSFSKLTEREQQSSSQDEYECTYCADCDSIATEYHKCTYKIDSLEQISKCVKRIHQTLINVKIRNAFFYEMLQKLDGTQNRQELEKVSDRLQNRERVARNDEEKILLFRIRNINNKKIGLLNDDI